MSLLSISAIEVGYHAETWQDAVREAGQLLVQNDYAKPTYIDAMVKMATELGPYIVMTPGVAIPHARPEEGALKVGFSAVKLAQPIEFGNKDNDPVFLVLAFCTPDSKAHVELLSKIAEALSQDDLLDQIKRAETKEDIANIFMRPEV